MFFPRVAIYLQMIKYFSHEEALALLIEAVRIGIEPDRRRLHMATKFLLFALYSSQFFTK